VYCVDAISDAFFRLTFFVIFLRRGRAQAEKVQQLLACALETRGEQVFKDFPLQRTEGMQIVSR
jgi:hypothetical protein